MLRPFLGQARVHVAKVASRLLRPGINDRFGVKNTRAAHVRGAAGLPPSADDLMRRNERVRRADGVEKGRSAIGLSVGRGIDGVGSPCSAVTAFYAH